MGWLIAAGVLVLLAVLPLGVDAKYDASGAQLWILAGPVHWKLLPGGKKQQKENIRKPEQKTKDSGWAADQKEQGGNVSDFIPLVRVVWDFLKDFRRKLRVNILQLKITLAGGDPSDMAVNYGKACAALAALDPQLERFFVIRKKDMQVQCDFLGEKTLVLARIRLTIPLGRLLWQLLRYGSRAVKEIIKIKKLRKGGALQ